MAENKERANILSTFLKFALILNVVTTIVCMAMLFITEDIYSIYTASICAASALINSIGLTLLMRWYHNGAFFIIGASLLSIVALSFTYAEWLKSYLGTIGLFAPSILFILYIGVLFILLNFKVCDKTAWQQMKSGLDLAHFKHIYQLSAVILIAIAIITFFEMPQKVVSKNNQNDDISTPTKNISEKHLDSPDITMEEVLAFEKEYNKKHDQGSHDERISKRILALKHLLLSELMLDLHNRENLTNICLAYTGEFSLQQQKILDWYLALDISQQNRWNICEKATSISDFKYKLESKFK